MSRLHHKTSRHKQEDRSAHILKTYESITLKNAKSQWRPDCTNHWNQYISAALAETKGRGLATRLGPR